MENDDLPVVSVLMTTYNRENYVASAIDSVLASTFEDFELVVVDDCSKDRTSEICREYASQDDRVHFFQNEKNLGDYPNRNRAASYARGRYLKYLDSDDMLYPHGLAVMVSTMERFTDAKAGLSAYAEADRPHPCVYSPLEAYRIHYFERDLLGRAPGSVIVNRKAFESVGGFSGKRQVGDHELWLKLAAKYSVVTMPRDLVWDRDHEVKESHADSIGEKAFMHQEILVAALEHDDCPLSQSARTEARQRLKALRKRQLIGAVKRGQFADALVLGKCLRIL